MPLESYTSHTSNARAAQRSLVSNVNSANWLISNPIVRLSVDQLQLIRLAIWKARVRWFDIGLGLLIDMSTLQSIRVRHRCNPDDCFTDMLYGWLCQDDPQPTLQTLVRTLRSSPIHEYYPGLDKELETALS